MKSLSLLRISAIFALLLLKSSRTVTECLLFARYLARHTGETKMEIVSVKFALGIHGLFYA